MKILFFGDVVSQPGCELVRKLLPGLKKKYQADFTVINGENSAVGNGITPESAGHLLASGADLLTTGNHVFRRAQIYPVLEERYPTVLRPYNLHSSCPGVGFTVLQRGGLSLGVGCLMGSVYMDSTVYNPFDGLDSLVKVFRQERVNASLIDFHAEATGEKRGMGFYADGRVSAVVGTHTHVQTADEQILPGGTAYITDVGMCGVKNSVLGVEPENVILKMRTGMPAKFEAAQGVSSLNGVLITIDSKTGRAESIERIVAE